MVEESCSAAEAGATRKPGRQQEELGSRSPSSLSRLAYRGQSLLVYQTPVGIHTTAASPAARAAQGPATSRSSELARRGLSSERYRLAGAATTNLLGDYVQVGTVHLSIVVHVVERVRASAPDGAAPARTSAIVTLPSPVTSPQ